MSGLQNRLFPPTCLLCGGAGAGARDLCAGCYADLPHNRQACRRCALPLVAAGAAECGRCLREPPPFTRMIAPFLYQPPLAELILDLKFRNRLTAARLLSDLLGVAIAAAVELPDCVIPVPLHPARLRQRSYNQAVELARPLARRFGLPLAFDALYRVRHTPPQVELDYQARVRNVRGAFALRRPLAARHIAILDDVVTTASTVGEIARLLRAEGAARVDVWACARTPEPGAS